MRILHITRRYAPMRGGIERYVQSVAEGQAASGHDVTVLTLDRDVIGDVPGRLPSQEILSDVRIVRLPGVGNRRFSVTLRPDRILREIRNADVVHQHDLRFMTGLVAAGVTVTRTPQFLHTHGLLFHTPWAHTLKRQAIRRYYGPLLQAASAWVLASSTPDRDLLLRWAPRLRKRTIIVQNATVLRPFLALQRRPEPGLLVTDGRLARHKGLDDLLRAAAGLETPWHLELSGAEDHEERVRLDGIAHALGIEDRVAFKGPYTDEEHLVQLERAALCVFPSRYEGFGLALLEAMAAGTPLLARDIPAHRAVLGESLSDRLFDADRPPSLTERIAAALAEPADELADQSARLRSRAAQFDISRLVGQIDHLYDAAGVAPKRRAGRLA